MLNRATNLYQSKSREGRGSSITGELDQHPGYRVAALFAGILVALMLVAIRLAYLQINFGDEYAGEFDKTIEKRETISSHDGRILGSGGEVLAEDLDLFGITVHYRWLEEPANPTWLKRQALARLDRADRRNPELVAREQERVLAERSALWKRLERLAPDGAKTVQARRSEIQRRVEAIFARVENSRQRPAADEEHLSETEPVPVWRAAWDAVVMALTTPPVRESQEPLVIQEQLDYHRLLSEVPLETAVAIEAHPEQYPGTRITVSTRRVYPAKSLAPHVIGYRLPITSEALAERKRLFPEGDPLDYQPGDRIGMVGLEKQYERHIRGLRGERKLILNRRGEVQRTEVIREPRLGGDLILALDVPLQTAAQDLLDDVLDNPHNDETNGQPLPLPRGGAIVALDVRTGAILAAASGPRFDPGQFVDHDQAAWQQTLADTRKPLFHRVTEMALPPGSVFKVLSAIAFLESGRVDPQREFFCQGYLDDPDHYRCFTFRHFGVGHHDVTLVDALARSCNVYFFAAARRIGATPLCDWGARFGFGRPTGVDLPGERGGNMPVSKIAPGSKNSPRNAADAMQLAIGQSRLTATPLQVARLLAAVANGGRLVTPHVVESVGPAPYSGVDSQGDWSGPTISVVEPEPITELSPRTLDWIRMGLVQVVAHPQGTGYKTVRLREISIAGKTGTAEPGRGEPDHAWFAGFVPAEKPRVAFVVVLENAGSGGHAAGPVARQFVQALLRTGLLGDPPVASPSAN